MSEPSEDDLIARHFAPLAGEGGLALADDAAVLAQKPGYDLVLTCDALVAGVHFFLEDPPSAIAAKALRVNLSDLAAKGATPAGFLLALALPAGPREDWLADFASGLRADIAHFVFPLLGGDTVSTPGPLMVSVTALGHVPARRMVPRTGARAGDVLYLSGSIGDAALGLQIRLGHFSSAAGDVLLERYLRPQPRMGLAPALLAHAHAAMDVSDGLVGDLRKMMRVSGVGAHVEIGTFPLSPQARQLIEHHPSALLQAITGGDDYEILATVPPPSAAAFEAEAAAAGVAVTRIGRVTAEPEVVLLTPEGAELDVPRGSYSHF